MRYLLITTSCLLAAVSAIPSKHNLHARQHSKKKPYESSSALAAAAAITAPSAPYGLGNATAILPTGTASAGLLRPQAASPDTKDSPGQEYDDSKPTVDTEAVGGKADAKGSESSNEGSSSPVVQGKNAAEEEAEEEAACDAATVTVTQNKVVTMTVSEGKGEAAPATSNPVKPTSAADTELPVAADPEPAQSSTSLTAALGSAPSSQSPPKNQPAESSTPAEDDSAAAPAATTPEAKPATADTAPAAASKPAAPDTPSAPAAGKLAFKTKRGIIASSDMMEDVAAAFGNTKVSWLGNWFSEAPKTTADTITFVPQNYGKESDKDGEWTRNAKKAVAAGSKYFLSFGEPGTPNDKLFMTPAQGAQLWREVMEPYAKQGVTIGAPGTLQNTQDFDWLKAFLQECNDCSIGFIALHWYDKAGAKQVPGFKETLEKARVVGNGRPVWLDNFQAQGSAEAQKEFLGEVVPWMDAQDYIQAYAFVPTSTQNGGDPGMNNGDALNDLGQFYANL